MSKPMTMLVHALLTFITISGGAFMAVAVDMEPGQSLSVVQWGVIGVTGLVAAAKDAQSRLAKPPVTQVRV